MTLYTIYSWKVFDPDSPPKRVIRVKQWCIRVVLISATCLHSKPCLFVTSLNETRYWELAGILFKPDLGVILRFICPTAYMDVLLYWSRRCYYNQSMKDLDQNCWSDPQTGSTVNCIVRSNCLSKYDTVVDVHLAGT